MFLKSANLDIIVSKKNLNKTSKDAVLSAAIQEVLNESPYNDNYGIQ